MLAFFVLAYNKWHLIGVYVVVVSPILEVPFRCLLLCVLCLIPCQYSFLLTLPLLGPFLIVRSEQKGASVSQQSAGRKGCWAQPCSLLTTNGPIKSSFCTIRIAFRIQELRLPYKSCNLSYRS